MFTTGLLPGNDDPLSDTLFFFFSLVTIPVDVAGLVFNVLNIIVLAKQNLNESMDLTLLALAIADLGGLLANLINCIFINPLFVIHETPIEPMEVMYVVSSLPKLSFSRASMWLILYVALERCLCVAMPLKVKSIVTKTRTKIFIINAFILAFVLFSPLSIASRIAWKFAESRNRSVLGIDFRSGFDYTMAVTSLTNGVVSFSTFIVVVILTVVLVVRLHQKSKWRTKHSSSGNDIRLLTRDRRLVKMVLVINIIFISCYFPSVVLTVVAFVIQEFTFKGKRSGEYFAYWNMAFFLESINSSFNIFVYYRMSSKFKAGLQKLLPFLGKIEQVPPK